MTVRPRGYRGAVAGGPPPTDIDVVADACSHQLGEAVAIISGYVGMMRESGSAEPAALRAVDGGVERVRRVVEDLLDLTRVAGRNVGHERVPLDVALDRAIHELGEDARALDVVAGPLPAVVGDPEQLVCLLRQLLRTAAAARGPQQPRVRVQITAAPSRPGHVLLAVVDDADDPRGMVGGLTRGRGPLVGAGAVDLILERVAAAHGTEVVRTADDGCRVELELPVAP